MKKILQFLKKLFSKKEKEIITTIKEEKITIKNINWDLINSLSKYDIVYVKMNDEEIEKGKIEKSHQQRPFIIMNKKDEKELAQGYYITSNITNNYIFRKEKFKGLKLVLNKNTYQFKKSGLILLHNNRELPYENIIHKISHINEHDLNKLKKYRNILCQNITVSTKEKKVIEIGDIILDNNINYVIYQMDNTNCYGYYIERSNDNINIDENHNYILFNHQLYFIDYKQNKTFNNNDSLYIISRFSNEIIEIIKNNKKKIKVELKNEKKEMKEKEMK